MTSLPLWLTSETPCSYLDDQRSQSLVVAPYLEIDVGLYGQLLPHGFRRGGDQVYKPHCPACRQCIPTRIPVTEFQANRQQRRCRQRNRHTQVVVRDYAFDERHFQLYCRYQSARHSGEDLPSISREDYQQFFASSWCTTWLVEFLMGGELAAVAVVDVVDQALSAVYTFFDPAFKHYSPGVFAVLWQIDEAKRRGLPFVYLGFWIGKCRKMSYKINYQPLQGLLDQQWQNLCQQQSSNEEHRAQSQ